MTSIDDLLVTPIDGFLPLFLFQLDVGLVGKSVYGRDAASQPDAAFHPETFQPDDVFSFASL